MKWVFNQLSKIIYPELCLSCDTRPPLNEHKLCLQCFNDLPFVRTKSDATAALEGKDLFPSFIDQYFSLFYYSKDGLVADMVHSLKYEGQYKTAMYLGHLLGQKMKDQMEYKHSHLLPVPIHPKRKQKRGYNQAEKIALGIGEVLGIPVLPDIIKRIDAAASQTSKNKNERAAALEDSFQSSTLDPDINHVIIIDDVLTTGATIRASALSLLSKNDCKISVATLGVSI